MFYLYSFFLFLVLWTGPRAWHTDYQATYHWAPTQSCFYFAFWGMVLLSSPGWLWTHSVVQAGLEITASFSDFRVSETTSTTIIFLGRTVMFPGQAYGSLQLMISDSWRLWLACPSVGLFALFFGSLAHFLTRGIHAKHFFFFCAKPCFHRIPIWPWSTSGWVWLTAWSVFYIKGSPTCWQKH